MNFQVDPTLCISCGLCAEQCPDVFQMSDDAAEVIANPVPDNQTECAKDAEEQCPVEAITHN
jgi:ferredoxin